MRRRTGWDWAKQFFVGAGRGIRDTAIIVVAWALFIAAMLYPALQLLGLLFCALLLLRGGDGGDWRSRDRVLKASRS